MHSSSFSMKKSLNCCRSCDKRHNSLALGAALKDRRVHVAPESWLPFWKVAAYNSLVGLLWWCSRAIGSAAYLLQGLNEGQLCLCQASVLLHAGNAPLQCSLPGFWHLSFAHGSRYDRVLRASSALAFASSHQVSENAGRLSRTGMDSQDTQRRSSPPASWRSCAGAPGWQRHAPATGRRAQSRGGHLQAGKMSCDSTDYCKHAIVR